METDKINEVEQTVAESQTEHAPVETSQQSSKGVDDFSAITWDDLENLASPQETQTQTETQVAQETKDTTEQETNLAEEEASGQETSATPDVTQTVAQLQAQILQMQQQMQQSQQSQAQANQAPEQSASPYANMIVPDEIVAAIQSDDPATSQQGIRQLTQGLAQTIHQELEKTYKAQIENLQTQLPQQIMQTQQIQKIEQDFYSAYPVLKNPAYRPLIQQQVALLQSNPAFAGKGWGKEMQDAIAQGVYMQLGLNPQQMQTQTNTQTNTKSKPNTFAPGSSGAFSSGTQIPDINSPKAIGSVWQ